MGKHLAGMGNLDADGVRPLLHSAHDRGWGGVVRLRSGQRVGALWLVKGHLVHAVRIEGKDRREGEAALQDILTWTEGACWLDAGVLPPARTLRAPLSELIGDPGQSRVEVRSAPADERLAALLENLRERVPGLESLSLTNGHALEATTAHDARQRDWLDGQLRRYFAEDRLEPERLFVQQGEYTLLIVKRGAQSAVLAARSGTAPEALFWAGEEARRQMMTVE